MASGERDRSAPTQAAPRQAGFGFKTERLFLPWKTKNKGSRFALSRLIVKHGYYITGQSGMPIQQYDSTAGAGRPISQQSSIGWGLTDPYGGDVHGRARLPTFVYRRMSLFASKKCPRLTAPVPSDDGSRKPAHSCVRKDTLLSRSMLS